MSMRTSDPSCCSSRASGMPLRGSLGSATMIGTSDRFSSMLKAYSAPSSACTTRAASASRGKPRCVHQILDHHVVGGDDAGEGAGLDGHVGQRRALAERQLRKAGTAELQHLADRAAALDLGSSQQEQHHVLGAHARAERARQYDAHASRHVHAHVAGEPSVGHVRAADAEGQAAEHARHAGVRVGADHELAGQRQILDHLVVTDGFAARGLAVAVDLAEQANAVTVRERALHATRAHATARPARARDASRASRARGTSGGRETAPRSRDRRRARLRQTPHETARRPWASRTRG